MSRHQSDKKDKQPELFCGCCPPKCMVAALGFILVCDFFLRAGSITLFMTMKKTSMYVVPLGIEN